MSAGGLHLEGKVQEWCNEVDTLTVIARTQPHAAYAHGLASKWSYLSQTVPDVQLELQPLENIIRTKLLCTCSDWKATTK